MPLLKTTPARSIEDVRRFFDRFAAENYERHGAPARLLAYRVNLLKRYLRPAPHETVLDVGCGDGLHLFALDGEFGLGIGADLSPAMIDRATGAVPPAAASRYRFVVDDAHTLSTLDEDSIDAAFCVGALEHMPDKPAVFRAVHRVLRPGGRFVCLTPNDAFLWYRTIAPRLDIATEHLETDRRIDAVAARTLLADAGFEDPSVAYWSFVPAGDMPAPLALLGRALDAAGRLILPHHLRGGLVFIGKKLK